MVDFSIIQELVDAGNQSYYLINASRFRDNFIGLIEELNNIFPHFNIAYSYKTNYTPSLCKIVRDLGGYAEVVSSMEYRLARKIGVSHEKIIFNGPYKERDFIYEVLTAGGAINIDNFRELNDISEHFRGYKPVNVALRCNYESCDGVLSRFGFDVESKEFLDSLKLIEDSPNLNLVGIHSHIANRGLDVWAGKVKGLCNIIEKHKLFELSFIDFGGGLYGGMPDELKKQFSSYIPNFKEYAQTIATPIKELFSRNNIQSIPHLLIEPGSAVVGDAMDFICTVDSIKNIRGHHIATVTGSMYNINPTLNHKNPPIHIIHRGQQPYSKINDCEKYDIAGYTCIESDYLYKGYQGHLEVGDIIIFGNAGSYSIVLKPPFILPNFPIYQYDNGEVALVKEGEIFDDIFHTYKF